MPLSDDFTRQLAEVDEHLEKAQGIFKRLAGEADFDNLPDQIVTNLKRKHAVLGYTREDLRDIPKIVASAEART